MVEGPITRMADMTIAGRWIRSTFVSALGKKFGNATAKVAYAQQRVQGEVEARLPDTRIARISGSVVVHPDHHELHVGAFADRARKATLGLAPAPAHPSSAGANRPSPHAIWFSTRDREATGTIWIAGELGAGVEDGRRLGQGSGRRARGCAAAQCPSWQGTGDGFTRPVTIKAGTLKDPGFSADVQGHRRWHPCLRLPVARGLGSLELGDGISGDVRLDQRPGTWLTARGSVPMDLFSSAGSAKPVDVAVPPRAR